MGSESNTIRVYFCTAFRDMHAERTYLHEVVFPRVSQQFQERGYVFEPVDPRWAAQSEDEAEGFGTLEHCLDEIERCRPYFIGILGSNYGKVLLEVPEHIGQKHPGIKHYFRCSRVHLETLHGALREPQKAKNSFFLFRKPDFLNDVPGAEKKVYLPNNAMEALNEVETHKLEVFKGAISTTGLSIMEYDCRWDPVARKIGELEDFGEKVAAAILSWIGVVERPVPRKATSLIGWSTPAPMPTKARPAAAAGAGKAAPAASPFDETIPMGAFPQDAIPEAAIPDATIPDAAAVVDEEPAYDVVEGEETEAIPLAEPPMAMPPAAAPAEAGDVDINALLAEDESALSPFAPPPPPPPVAPSADADDLMALAEEEITGAGGVPAAAAEHKPPPYVDQNVQFSVFRPKTIPPEKWETLLAFAHLAEKAPDAPEEEPDPVEEVQRQAKQVLGEKAEDYVQATRDSSQAVPREGELTFVPEVDGIEFNPERRSFFWTEPVHREEFRMKASAEKDGESLRGRLSVFLGSILLADVPITIKVDSQAEVSEEEDNTETTAAQAYRKIFASYSHADSAVVEQFKNHAKALGDRYLQDCIDLRAGEEWNDRLMELIDEADVFQLFWSTNSMRSENVRKEWEHALKSMKKKKKPYFVRPTYWEDPLPEDPDEGLPPESLLKLHFQRIFSVAPSTHPGGGGGESAAFEDMDTAVEEGSAAVALEDDAEATAVEEEGPEFDMASESAGEVMMDADDSEAVSDMDEDMDDAPRPSRSKKAKKGGSKLKILLLLLFLLLALGGAAVYFFVLS